VSWTRERDLVPGEGGRLDEILAAFRDEAERGELSGAGGVTLGFKVLRAPRERAAIVIAPGRTESLEKYAELAFDLRARGYSCYLLDHRGQGSSTRLLGSDRPPGHPERQKGHVERFEHYVEDLAAFVETVVERDPHPALFGFGHSMGGGILTRYAQRYPDALRGLALFAPMHGIGLSLLGRAFVRLAVLLGRGTSYATGHGPWDPSQWESFEVNRTTSSARRYAHKQALINADPGSWVGGPTFRWAHEASQATRRMHRDAPQMKLPILLLQAGREELVRNQAQDDVAARAPRCVKVRVDEARHELYLESDALRDRALDLLAGFLDEHTAEA
jgi:lysophospholipase